jgi:hypothetical protein
MARWTRQGRGTMLGNKFADWKAGAGGAARERAA